MPVEGIGVKIVEDGHNHPATIGVKNDPTSLLFAFTEESPYFLRDGVSLEDPIPVVMVFADTWTDQAGNLLTPFPMNTSGVLPPAPPPEPGPMDVDWQEDGLINLSFQYSLATDMSVMGVVTRYEGTLTNLVATHDGEPLRMLGVPSINTTDKIASAIFLGNFLSVVPGNVIITPIGGATVGPALARINDDFPEDAVDSDWTAGDTGNANGRRPNPPAIVSGVSGEGRLLFCSGTDIAYSPPYGYPESENPTQYWGVGFVGTRVDMFPLAIDSGDTTWALVGGEYVSASGGSGKLEGTFSTTFNTRFGIEVDIDIPAGTTLRFQFIVSSGLQQTAVAGPFNGVWRTMSGVETLTPQSVSIYTNGPAVIKSFKYIQAPKTIMGVFGRTAAPVSNGHEFQMTLPNTAGYAISAAEIHDVAPAPNSWSPFTLTAGSNVFGWGYARPPIVTAALGSISNEPYSGAELIGFFEAPDDSQVIVSFLGDVVDELDGYTFKIDGTVLPVVTAASYNPGSGFTNMFIQSFFMLDGQEYEVERVAL